MTDQVPWFIGYVFAAFWLGTQVARLDQSFGRALVQTYWAIKYNGSFD